MKTVSLQLSQELKENGYPQGDNKFYWCEFYNDSSPKEQRNTLLNQLIIDELVDNYRQRSFLRGFRDYASPTADEILEKLPVRITNPSTRNMDFLRINPGDDSKQDDRRGWTLEYHTTFSAPLVRIIGDSLADAAAKMWLYLKENNLLQDV